MKVVHICLASFFSDGFGYQENLITKYQKKHGIDVTVISSQLSYNKAGEIVDCLESGYINKDGVKIIRIKAKLRLGIRRLNVFPDLINVLNGEAPDIIFVHCPQFCDIKTIGKYVRNNPNVILYVDNHSDFSNSARNWISRIILHKLIWRHYIKKCEPYVKCFYGVLPARVKFLTDLYGLPLEKCKLLVMGGDDELIALSKAANVREEIRKKWNIDKDDILIVTGGKINNFRKEVLNLMLAVKEIVSSHIKLIVFGAVIDELKPVFNKLCDDKKVLYAGWIDVTETYGFIEASDLMVFPGLHSVLWEQAIAQGKPCIFRDIEGFHHVDVGGNARFLKDTSVEGIKKVISEVVDNSEGFNKMKEIAKSVGSKEFSYDRISLKCIQYEGVQMEK